jgi:hypothetical protein
MKFAISLALLKDDLVTSTRRLVEFQPGMHVDNCLGLLAALDDICREEQFEIFPQISVSESSVLMDELPDQNSRPPQLDLLQ